LPFAPGCSKLPDYESRGLIREDLALAEQQATRPDWARRRTAETGNPRWENRGGSDSPVSRTPGRLTLVARKVSARLKPNSLTEFINLMESEILPWLRTQEGFLDLITLAVPNGREVATISFWEDKGNAQAFNSSGYPEAVKVLEKLLDGSPYVKTFDVVSSTFQRVAVARPPEAEEVARCGAQRSRTESPLSVSMKRSLTISHY